MLYLYRFVVHELRSGIEYITQLLKICEYEILVGICVFFLAFVIALLVKNLRSNFPPGPTGLPFVGYLPFLSQDLHLDFSALGRNYGDVFSVRVGSRTIVVLHGSEAIREAFNKTEFLGRPPVNGIELINPISAFFGPDFHAWKEQRRFVVQSMKDLGLGKTKIEEDIKDEINHFVEKLKDFNGEPMDLNDLLTPSMSNNISALVFGKRYDYDDPDRQFLDKNLEVSNDSFTQFSLDVLYPWIRRIPFLIKFLKIDKSLTAFNNFRAFSKKELDKHIKSFNPGNSRDFIDKYLLEINSQREKNPDTTFNYDLLVSNAIDLFTAGSETVHTSILWHVYTMAAFPEIQKKVQQEIMEVAGPHRNPEFLDMKRMPYTSAVIFELMRWKTILPLNVMRYTLADSTVSGYDIPKGTIVMANFWNAHHDSRYWKDPDQFKPERFLSQEGKSVVKSKNYMPFSLGRRVCPGESMAYLEIFLYFTSMLQKFDVAFSEGMTPTFRGKLNITYRLESFLVKFIPRT